ncbi:MULTISPECIES: cupin domain-containing protein [Halorussus]|uniref:cupin domain-containing protein n=1 Tax=Halorussus TaxID=1070314 RepID=UPI00209E65BA|nr:cupin domain-containing protein [Halorussus vallis]USZ76511.1 cupin domain-containing protein [Halorussus vallis]
MKPPEGFLRPITVLREENGWEEPMATPKNEDAGEGQDWNWELTEHLEQADRTTDDRLGIGRRPLLKALGAGAALSVGSNTAIADDTEDDGERVDRAKRFETEVNQAEGFETEVVAPHATFPDDVAAAYGVAYRDGAAELAFVPDASTVVLVRARLEPGGTSGWHVDRGPAIAVVVEGEIDVTFGDRCVTRTYTAGEAVVATGKHADIVENASDTQPAMAYIIFLGVPAGEPPSNPVEPPDC